MSFLRRYTIRRVYSSDGTPITEVLDHKRTTCSRFIDHYPDQMAIDILAGVRRELREKTK